MSMTTFRSGFEDSKGSGDVEITQCVIAKVRCVIVKCLQNALSQVSRSAAEVIIIRYEGAHTQKREGTHKEATGTGFR